MAISPIIGIRVPPTLDDDLRRRARREGRTLSDLIRELLYDALIERNRKAA